MLYAYICCWEQECDAAVKEGFMSVGDLRPYNLATSVWMHTKKKTIDFTYPHSKKVLAQDWFDEKLDKCIQARTPLD